MVVCLLELLSSLSLRFEEDSRMEEMQPITEISIIVWKTDEAESVNGINSM
jgi:hypothetical protein